jgi:Zn ribbon nucleic-acid-binding protein
MYANGEGLGTSDRQSPPEKALKNRDGVDTFLISKRFVRCICPRCRKTFNVHMMWSGRGMPRKYCADCKVIVGNYDESAIFESMRTALAPAKKSGRGVTEE